MIWADKASLGLAATIAATAVLSTIVVFIGVGTVTDMRLNIDIAMWTLVIELAVVIPVWLLFRLIDLFAGGPSARRRKRKANTREGVREPRMGRLTPEPAQDLRK